MVNFVYELHSGLRWIVAALALILLVRSLYGWLASRQAGALDQQLSLAFTISYGIQFLIGVVLLFLLGTYTRHQFEHLGVMFVAVAVAGLLGRWRRLPDAARFRNSTVTLLVFGVLVYLGVALLPQGWTF